MFLKILQQIVLHMWFIYIFKLKCNLLSYFINIEIPKSYSCNKKGTTECINQFNTTLLKPKYISYICIIQMNLKHVTYLYETDAQHVQQHGTINHL